LSTTNPTSFDLVSNPDHHGESVNAESTDMKRTLYFAQGVYYVYHVIVLGRDIIKVLSWHLMEGASVAISGVSTEIRSYGLPSTNIERYL
jgi:hypothetical protein